MNNHVEILRAILYTKEDMDTIINLKEIEDTIKHEFIKEKEIPLMTEFKKIYELGTDQLEKFLKLLHDVGPEGGGKEVDTYTIEYYMQLLRNGPLGSNVKKLTTEDERFNDRYWPNTPDCLGNNANKTRSSANITVFESVGYQLGCVTDTFNRLPAFMQTSLIDSIKVTEDLFRSNMKSSTEVDNTLPMVDKRNQQRYNEESKGLWVTRPHGTMMVKDSYFYLVIDFISEDLFDKVKEHLKDKDGKDETYRLYKDKKQYTAFDSDKNESEASVLKIEKEFTDGDNKETIDLDLMGDEFDSFTRRETVLKISNPIKDEEFKLNTNQGQLGN